MFTGISFSSAVLELKLQSKNEDKTLLFLTGMMVKKQ